MPPSLSRREPGRELTSSSALSTTVPAVVFALVVTVVAVGQAGSVKPSTPQSIAVIELPEPAVSSAGRLTTRVLSFDPSRLQAGAFGD